MLIDIHINQCPPIDLLPFEVVERKSLGHPDTICDLIAEELSFKLKEFYLKECGKALHYNLDKALLIGGTSQPKFKGGITIEPARLVIGDRAIKKFGGRDLGLDNLIETSINRWLEQNLKNLRLKQNLILQNEIKEGSAPLNLVEDKNIANDTSVGVGYWPKSVLENLTLSLDAYLNSQRFQKTHLHIGEDKKIMIIRNGATINLILASAFIDKYIEDAKDYQQKKEHLAKEISDYIEKHFESFELQLSVNELDDFSRGAEGLYLTVTGLSCEGGDSGQVGRGNRVNGVIPFMRHMTMEAWAGKNSDTHIGKIYSHAAQNLARVLVDSVDEVCEATITLVGRIGHPVAEPSHVFADCKISKKQETAILEEIKGVLSGAIKQGAVFKVKRDIEYSSIRCER